MIVSDVLCCFLVAHGLNHFHPFDLPGDPSKRVLLSGTGVPGACQKMCDFGDKKDELLLY